jgi:hypothetical protein
MRVQLTRADQLRRTTPEQLPSYCDAVLSQFQEIESAVNAWADLDHNSDGSHSTIRLGAPGQQIVLDWDGTNLTWTKPDGTTGNLV